MKCIAIGNKKGGVGKSTLAVNLGCELAARGRDVTLFDTDEQGTVTDWCTRGELPVRFRTIPIENAETAKVFIQEVKDCQSGIVIIDLPPHTREATEAAMMVCDLFLIPVTASGADFISTRKAIDLLDEGRKLRDGRPHGLLVPSRVDRRTSFGKEITGALEGFGLPVGPPVGQRSIHVDCFGLGDWVGHVEPKSIAYEEIRNLTDRIEEIL